MGGALGLEPSICYAAPMRSLTWHAVLGALALVAALGVATTGCRRNGQPGDGAEGDGSGGAEAAADEGPPEGWPRVLVVGPGTEPALYFGAEENAPAFGYINAGVRVRIESGVRNGRVEALLAGPLPTKGWVPVDRIAAYAKQRGRVDGTPFYLGPNDFVNVLGPADEAGQMRVAVRPWLGGATFLDARVGTFPAEQLGDRPVDEATAEQPTPGQCYRLPAGQTVPVYERPTGQPVASLPAQDPPLTVTVLRERAPWFGIRAGFGPYIVGYVQAPLTPCEGPAPEPQPMTPPSSGETPYWMSQESGTLHRVAAGTRVRFNGRTIARLREQGWAREIARQEGDQVDVFLAVNDDLAVRGLVPADALTPVEGQPATAPSAPAAPVPDELAE